MYLDRRLLALAAAHRPRLLVAIGLGLGAGLATVVQATALARVVAGAFVDGAGLAALRPALGWFGAAMVLRAVLTWGSEVVAAGVAIDVKQALRRRLLARILALGPLRLGQRPAGELSATLQQGVEALDPYLRHYLPQLALSALVPLAVAVVVLGRDLLSGAVLLVTAPLIPLFMVLVGGQAQAVSRRQWQSLQRLSAQLLDALQGLGALKLLGRARAHAARLGRLADAHRDATLRVLRIAFLSALALEAVATLSTALVAVEVGLRVLHGRLAFEPAFAVLLLAPEFYLPLRLLGARFHAGVAGVAAAEAIFALLDDTPASARAHDTAPIATAPPVAAAPARTATDATTASAGEHRTPPRVVCLDLRFTYPGARRPALDGVDLELGPGEVVALVGASGAGKSTLARLLLGFAAPDQGQILVDGVPLARLPLDAWRARLAYVPERPHLFAGSIADNLRLARPGASADALERAARAACVDDVIAALPAGYATDLGEGGQRLSTGQAQRLALARAFVADAPLLILDEVTAHQDPALEARLQVATAELLQGRSALVIAHRLRTVLQADRVVVLDGGRVVEQGPPAALLAAGGALARLRAAARGERP